MKPILLAVALAVMLGGCAGFKLKDAYVHAGTETVQRI